MKMRKTVIVKLGGSVITYKGKYRRMRVKVSQRLVNEMAPYLNKGGNLILVHGAGSFGHIIAEKQKLHLGVKDRSKAKYVCIVQKDVRDLSLRLMKMMVDAGLKPTNISPANVLVKIRTKIESLKDFTMSYEPFKNALEQGMCPVTFGDVVPDEQEGCSIISGDDLVLALARKFKAEQVIFVTNVDGVFKRWPSRSDKDLIKTIHVSKGVDKSAWGKTEVSDVTGSMMRKTHLAMEMAGRGTKVCIINGLKKGRLADALKGKVKGTTIVKK